MTDSQMNDLCVICIARQAMTAALFGLTCFHDAARASLPHAFGLDWHSRQEQQHLQLQQGPSEARSRGLQYGNATKEVVSGIGGAAPGQAPRSSGDARQVQPKSVTSAMKLARNGV